MVGPNKMFPEQMNKYVSEREVRSKNVYEVSCFIP